MADPFIRQSNNDVCVCVCVCVCVRLSADTIISQLSRDDRLRVIGPALTAVSDSFNDAPSAAIICQWDAKRCKNRGRLMYQRWHN